MINLLLPEEKRTLQEEEKWKSTMILGILILVFLIWLSLILFSIKTFISGGVEAQKILYDQREKEFENPKIQSLQSNLTTFNLTLSRLDTFYQGQLNLTDILEKISKTLPVGTHLTSLSLSPKIEKKKEYLLNCALAGFSPTQVKLLKFKENLEKEERFSEINFPLTNWVKPIDINFTVNFQIK